MTGAFCDPFEREIVYTLSRIHMHARVGWLLVQRSAKQLVADDCVLLVEMIKGSAASRYSLEQEVATQR
jgi:hypothetical protein